MFKARPSVRRDNLRGFWYEGGLDTLGGCVLPASLLNWNRNSRHQAIEKLKTVALSASRCYLLGIEL